MIIVLSKRKLESYRRAELTCQELRQQLAANNISTSVLADFVIHWMDVTGEVKYNTPRNPRKRR